MAEKKKERNERGHFIAGPNVPAPKKNPCCKKLEKIQNILTNVPTYLPPDTLKEVRKVLEAPMSDYE